MSLELYQNAKAAADTAIRENGSKQVLTKEHQLGFDPESGRVEKVKEHHDVHVLRTRLKWTERDDRRKSEASQVFLVSSPVEIDTTDVLLIDGTEYKILVVDAVAPGTIVIVYRVFVK